VDDLRPARTDEPDVAAISTAVQFAAALVFAYKDHQRSEEFWHGVGRLSRLEYLTCALLVVLAAVVEGEGQ